ncbi:MAG TPA: vitamin K epoxide reductase family protein [Ornithinibacter sp.]|uniref:vitamin K epoxide reductase family protein n=1 Tax=Ornithinibacter sp. TaxID=2862748 RepID=UPI002C9B483C|nr:vitamin K epoxide reductase family protein [Ornithinibacter sp.]HNV40113.1 vitamin K epoxide reductase family protein [Ornithinibacter sp.]HOB79020.1 vitamin K epoxide reductase family protein [Ornithinibacter sp.]HPV89137.1 vitamin K epoxide reductase family protein [Ornithinibacter sp.]HQA12724.1 vitamin K epoxide reductase family protein [Ornithinibacter sp.]HQV81706.1 vitamin K epoxide reductase family protein [Ornithinibacter sp.]
MSSTSSRTPPATADSPTPGPAAGASTDGRWVAIAMILAGSAGALASAALIVEKVAVLADPTHVPSCSINPVISCGSVMMSWQAELLGFPNPVLGLAGFPVVAASGAAILAGGHLRRWYWLALLAGSLAGVGLVHWLIFQSLYRIGALCPYCMVVWVCAVVTLVAVSALLAKRGILPSFLARYAPTIFIAWLAVIATLATIRFRDYWATLIF